MNPLETVHTFTADMAPHHIHILKRVDTHQVTVVAIMAVADPTIPLLELGPMVCEAFNAELLGRAKPETPSPEGKVHG